jgi:hypothetical protein
MGRKDEKDEWDEEKYQREMAWAEEAGRFAKFSHCYYSERTADSVASDAEYMITTLKLENLALAWKLDQLTNTVNDMLQDLSTPMDRG